MLYVVTALFEEAMPFIKKYNLKYRTDFPHFDVFTGREFVLLITRPGALRAVAALSSVLTAFPPKEYDLLLSAGCAGCASKDTLGRAFILSRITDAASGRTRYPELLYRCPFPEAEVVTQAVIRLQETDTKEVFGSLHSQNVPSTDIPGMVSPLPLLYDMEAAGIYEAAIPYFSCDRLVFIKVVSDALTGLTELSPAARRAQVTDCMAGVMPVLTDWLFEIYDFLSQRQTGDGVRTECQSCTIQHSFDFRTDSPHSQSPSHLPKADRLGADGESFFIQVCSALHLSTANSYKLYQLLLYLTLSKIPYMDSMRELLAAPLAMPCRTKKEGIKYLEELNQHYL